MPLEQLDPSREWRLKTLSISGNKNINSGELEEILSTKTRPWYAPWESRPLFDSAVFAADLQRLVSFYQDKGYYETKVSHDLEVDTEEGLVTAKIQINEGEPIRVAQLSVELLDAPEFKTPLNDLLVKLPLREGAVFAVEAYQQTEAALKEFFYNRHRALVEIRRQAQVIIELHEARVSYTIKTGPETKFGETFVEGLKDVRENVVLAELTYKPGEPFSGTALKNTERNLRGLDLFSLIRIEPQPSAKGLTTVPIKIRLEEKPRREIKIGIGYGTEDQLRGQIRWRDNNWLGGGRRLEAGIKASFIVREADLHFVQPHFLAPQNRLLVDFGPQQFDEPGYFLNATRLQPKIERKFSELLTGFLSYRVEYDRLKDLPQATIQDLNPFPLKGWLSGLSAGLIWNTADDPLNATRGWTASLLAEQVGGFLGGQYDFYKLIGDIKGYYPLAERTVIASRFKIGFAQPFDGAAEVPVFERFFAGGSNSVRGYGRSLLGPRSSANDPVGGRSLIEGSVELRQKITDTIGAVLFLDFGQVSTRSFDPPVNNLKFAPGLGLRYITPVGPLRLDAGFPIDPAPRNRSWQIFFSIGQAF